MTALQAVSMNGMRAHRYANLWSLSGQEALARSLEDPTIKRVADGRLKIDDILGMTEGQTISAFGIVRWAECSGVPTCPKCRTDMPYYLPSRARWKCRGCEHQFSMTSGTVLSSRKTSLRNYLFALSLVLDKSQFASLLEYSRELGLNYRSAHALVGKLKACTIDAQGCTVPFSLIDRAAWLLRRSHIRSNLTRSGWQSTSSLNYPYLRTQPKTDTGADLMIFANGLVPKGLPDYVRADICQDIIVAILAGEASRDQVSKDTRKYISSVLQASSWKYKWMSFDAPLGAEDSARSLHDIMAAPEGASYDEAVAVSISDSRERARTQKPKPIEQARLEL